MIIKLIGANGMPVYVNPDQVVFLGEANAKGAPIIGQTGIKMVTGEIVLVKGTCDEIASALDPNFLRLQLAS